MNDLKRYIPDGMHDILLEECEHKDEIEESFKKVYTQSGFNEIMSPMLEFYDVFNASSKIIDQEKMYKLFDNRGRILVLRPEMTTPIARIASTKFNKSFYPLKLWYNAEIFRVNEDMNGKMNEITQSGVEIIGSSSIKADVEVIETSINALKKAGVTNFIIEIGQANFFKSIIESTKLNEEESEIVRLLIENKSFTELEKFIDNKKDKIDEEDIKILKEIPKMFGGIEVVDYALSITKNDGAVKSLLNIKEIYKMLNAIGDSSYIKIDLGMVQHIKYYTGIIFRAFGSELKGVLLSGGRYDNLLGQFGEDAPATGFAINVDNVLSTLYKQEDVFKEVSSDFLLFYDKDEVSLTYDVLKKLKDKGYRAEISLFDSEDSSIKYAESKKIDIVLNIQNEFHIKVINLKDKSISILNINDFGGKNETTCYSFD